MSSLIYTKFTMEMLKTAVHLDLSKHAMRLWLYYELHSNIKQRVTHPKTDDEIAEEIGIHRTTVIRARAELERKCIIKPTKQTLNNSNVYHLLHDTSEAKVATAVEVNTLKENEKKFTKEKTKIENQLGRRLSKYELKNLREQYGI